MHVLGWIARFPCELKCVESSRFGVVANVVFVLLHIALLLVQCDRLLAIKKLPAQAGVRSRLGRTTEVFPVLLKERTARWTAKGHPKIHGAIF